MAQAAAMSAPEPEAERLRIAICTDDSRVLPEARQYLATDFETYFLESWDQLGPLLEQQALHAVLLDIDMLGESSLNGIRALQELRNGQPDLVLVALTRSQARSLRLKAGQAGADEYFVAAGDERVQHAFDRIRAAALYRDNRMRISCSCKFNDPISNITSKPAEIQIA